MNVDFGSEGYDKLKVNALSMKGGKIEIRFDDVNAKAAGVLEIPKSDSGEFEEYTIDIEPVTGVHDVYFVYNGFANGKMFEIDSWQFINDTSGGDTPTDAPDIITMTKSENGDSITIVSPDDIENVKLLRVEFKNDGTLEKMTAEPVTELKAGDNVVSIAVKEQDKKVKYMLIDSFGKMKPLCTALEL